MLLSWWAGAVTRLIAPDNAHSPVTAASARPSSTSCDKRPEALGGACRNPVNDPHQRCAARAAGELARYATACAVEPISSGENPGRKYIKVLEPNSFR